MYSDARQPSASQVQPCVALTAAESQSGSTFMSTVQIPFPPSLLSSANHLHWLEGGRRGCDEMGAGHAGSWLSSSSVSIRPLATTKTSCLTRLQNKKTKSYPAVCRIEPWWDISRHQRICWSHWNTFPVFSVLQQGLDIYIYIFFNSNRKVIQFFV